MEAFRTWSSAFCWAASGPTISAMESIGQFFSWLLAASEYQLRYSRTEATALARASVRSRQFTAPRPIFHRILLQVSVATVMFPMARFGTC
jgi:hypothetical protein